MNHSAATDLANPKRGRTERGGIHAWLPYYAGFSEAFVLDAARLLGLTTRSLLLDPMNGSGTTTLVAQKLGLAALGTDINPAMVRIARAKDAAFAHRPALADLISRVADEANSASEEFEAPADTLEWFSAKTSSALRRLRSAISRVGAQEIPRFDTLSNAPTTRAATHPAASLRDFLFGALAVTGSRLSSAASSKNPTWLKKSDGSSVDHNTISEFVQIAHGMVADLDAEFTNGSEVSRALILEADAKALPFNDSCIDGIITSPPYLTRIDYTATTAPALFAADVDNADELRRLREATMGSTCIVKGRHDDDGRWGATCSRILAKIQRHKSKASATYYYKTYIQYFADARDIVAEYLRVLRPGSTALLVVQDSWYKDIHVPLDKLYCELGESLGATAKPVRSFDVRFNMTQVNTRARKYSKGDVEEHVIAIRKP